MKERIELNANAVTLRERLGEDPYSPIDVFSIINSLANLTMVFYPMSDRISGMCSLLGADDKLIAINSKTSYGRQRFTAAHELYHLNFQVNFTNVICAKDIDGVKDHEERNADSFASFFLAPYEALERYVMRNFKKTRDMPISTSELVRIEQHFGMSRYATLYRLKADGYRTIDDINSLKFDVIKSARKLGFDDTLYIPTPTERQYFTTGSYIDMVEKLKQKEVISQGKYEEFLLQAFRSDIVYNLDINDDEKYD